MMDFDFELILYQIKNETYSRIGVGSGRQVYDLNNGYVVKAVRNRKGYAQNQTEYLISETNSTSLIANVEKISDDFNLLIMKKAEKINVLSDVYDYFGVSNRRELFRVEPIYSFYKNNNLLLSDLIRASSWGKIDDVPVIIDYGFTKNVRQKYYGFF